MERQPTFEILKSSPHVISYIKKPGIYRLKKQSSTGKTYLCKTLKQCRMMNIPVDGYDYYDYFTGRSFASLLDKGLKLVMVDRFDMYNGKIEPYLSELAKDCIVLIDCNAAPNIDSTFSAAYVSMTESEIIIE